MGTVLLWVLETVYNACCDDRVLDGLLRFGLEVFNKLGVCLYHRCNAQHLLNEYVVKCIYAA